jgi:hypothetical protein
MVAFRIAFTLMVVTLAAPVAHAAKGFRSATDNLQARAMAAQSQQMRHNNPHLGRINFMMQAYRQGRPEVVQAATAALSDPHFQPPVRGQPDPGVLTYYGTFVR